MRLNPFQIDEECWEFFLNAANSLPDNEDERSEVLSVCKQITLARPINESELFESIHNVAMCFADYRILSDVDRGYVQRAFYDALSDVDSDLVDTALGTIKDSPSCFLPSPGYAYSLIEPLNVSRYEYRKLASRLATQIDPGLRVITNEPD